MATVIGILFVVMIVATYLNSSHQQTRSLIAHEDSVTGLRFQPQTHYFFSCGKDGVVKYWDADRYVVLTHLTNPGGLSYSLFGSGLSKFSISRVTRLLYGVWMFQLMEAGASQLDKTGRFAFGIAVKI